MDAKNDSRSRGGAIRTCLWSAALVAVLVACAVAGRFHREIAGLVIGLRMAAGGDCGLATGLWSLEKSAVPGCRLAYRLSGDGQVRRAAARAMGIAGATDELVALARSEGAGSDAEKGLVEMIEGLVEFPMPLAADGAEIIFEDDLPPPDGMSPAGGAAEHIKTALVYRLGDYEVEVQIAWSRQRHFSGGSNIPCREWWGPWKEAGCLWRVSRDDRGDAPWKYWLLRTVDEGSVFRDPF